MKHILTELNELEQKRQYMMSELIAELVEINPEEFEDYELINQVGIALNDSWSKHKGDYGSQGGYDIDYSLSCDGAYFNKGDILYQDTGYTLVHAEIYDDANYYTGLVLLSTKNCKGETS